MKYFWESWKNTTNLEKKAIKSALVAKKIILSNVPKDQIIAIFIKGSFPRRELIEKSDLDTVTVLKSKKYTSKLKELEKKYKKKYDPSIQLSNYTLYELKTSRVKPGRASTSRFVKHIPLYEQIYGEKLDTSKFPIKSDEQDYVGMLKAFDSIFFPNYEQKKMGFKDIAKQVFWLYENEQKAKGRTPEKRWKVMVENSPENHIVREAYELRQTKKIDSKTKKKFIEHIKRYVSKRL
ncbi:hypothetical protein K9L97_03225 [Candidatus Woesearchaeota archaeon]|nr:hypothetical protein [Candidatus Woesearchaeota archaeon]